MLHAVDINGKKKPTCSRDKKYRYHVQKKPLADIIANRFTSTQAGV